MSQKPYQPTIDEILKLTHMKEFMREEVMDALAKPENSRKIVVVDPTVVGMLMSVLDTTDLPAAMKPKGVVDVQHLSHEKLNVTPESPKNVIYVVRSTIPAMKLLARRVKDDAMQNRRVDVYMVPRKTLVCERVLEELRAKECIYSLSDLELDLVPIEADYLTMDLDYCFREIALEGDASSLSHVAKSLMKFQAFYGNFPTVRGKGKHAEKVAMMLQRMKAEVGEAAIRSGQAPECEALYIFDREVDPLTPLLYQKTYEGLLDEVFGINNQLFKPPFPISTEDEKLNGKTHKLTAEADKIYKQIRGVHWQSLGMEVKACVDNVKAQIQEKEHLTDLKETRAYLSRVGDINDEKAQCAMHLAIAKEILDTVNRKEMLTLTDIQQDMLDCVNESRALEYIEECMYRSDDLAKVLRLICMQSMTFGLTPAKYASLKTQLVQNYGIQVLLTLDNLEKANLVDRKKGSTANSFKSWIKSQITMERQDDRDTSRPKDISYAHGGWVPPLARLAEMAVTGKLQWNAMEAALSEIPGPTFNYRDDTYDYYAETGSRVIMLFFIGGVTHSEIALLRFIKDLAQARYAQEGIETNIIIATTKIINGSNFIEKLYGALR
eukprot:TRINITY_DN5571_c0_g1_i1.p1 TRINITY_DN5571_c0_g1~~TRINITY_DN5571_c0_g1_i1.p1  ORF type:complete len:608 (+),score=201.61 TRINITY_DN5571_c0_g1_i1:46-1869(+)